MNDLTEQELIWLLNQKGFTKPVEEKKPLRKFIDSVGSMLPKPEMPVVSPQSIMRMYQ